MKPSRIAAVLAAAALALLLAACGGGGSGSSSSSSAEPAPHTESTSSTASDSAGSQSTSSSGDLTAPGTKLSFGEAATVGWVPPSTYDPTAAQPGLELRVTVESIERGAIADFENIELEPDQRSSTPYYVKVEVEALGKTDPPSIDDPDVSFEAIDDRGQEQSSITFIGEFPHCEDASPPRPFTAGKSYESCLTYLMPGGGSIEKVEWNDGPAKANEVTPYFDNPLAWEAG